MNPVMFFVFNVGGFIMQQNMVQGIQQRAEGVGEPPPYIEMVEIILWFAGFLAGLVAAVLFVTALGVGDPAGEPLAIVGTVVTVVAPTSIGLGQILYGAIKGRRYLVTSGARIVKVGLAIFIADAVFFELIIGISGFGLGNWGWRLLLIALGVLLLARYFLPARKSQ
jgi:hypothetical protein